MNKNSFIKYLVNPLSCVYLRVIGNRLRRNFKLTARNEHN